MPWDGNSASLLQDRAAEEQDQEEASSEMDDRDIPAAALEEACRRIAASSAAESLGVAFHCGVPGFAGPLSAAVWEEVALFFLRSMCRLVACLQQGPQAALSGNLSRLKPGGILVQHSSAVTSRQLKEEKGNVALCMSRVRTSEMRRTTRKSGRGL